MQDRRVKNAAGIYQESAESLNRRIKEQPNADVKFITGDACALLEIFLPKAREAEAQARCAIEGDSPLLVLRDVVAQLSANGFPLTLTLITPALPACGCGLYRRISSGYTFF